MKMQWSVFYSFLLLFTLVSCGGEQFGSTPQSSQSAPDPVKQLSHSSCSTHTLIKPKVDVLYVVDNSTSTFYIPDSIKSSLSNTVNSLSTDFDYRVIGTTLLPTPGGNSDYQVMTNSSDLAGIPGDSRRISSASQFDFFKDTVSSTTEAGLGRIISFIDTHKNSLLRRDAYTIIVLVSNGHDQEVEKVIFGNGETELVVANWNARLSDFRRLKTQLDAIQLRLISVTAHNVCGDGYRTAHKSYVKMSKQLYVDAQASDSSVQDSYDLCSGGGINSIFSAINNSIKQVVLKHEYSYWPISFANATTSIPDIRVHKVSQNGQSVELVRDSQWFYEGGAERTVQTRSGPNPIPGPGEPVTGQYFVRFAQPIVYPDCVLITSVTKTEYFQYVVLPQKPKAGTVALRINGRLISQSTTNGWSFSNTVPETINIKAPYPNAGDDQPPVVKTGFMLKLNGSNNYYKSGDNVQVDYIPEGI